MLFSCCKYKISSDKVEVIPHHPIVSKTSFLTTVQSLKKTMYSPRDLALK